jgi:hypothetical protein
MVGDFLAFFYSFLPSLPLSIIPGQLHLIQSILLSLVFPRTAQCLAAFMFSPSLLNGEGTTASADFCHTSIWLLSQGYRLRPGDRSPQVRALTFPAYLPHLLLRLLVASDFVVSSQLAQSHSLMRFVFLKSQVCLRLPSDITSQ